MYSINDGLNVSLTFRSTLLDILISLSASTAITLAGKWTGDVVSGSVAAGLAFILFMLLRLERKLDAVCGTVYRVDMNTRKDNAKPSSPRPAQPQVSPEGGAQ